MTHAVLFNPIPDDVQDAMHSLRLRCTGQDGQVMEQARLVLRVVQAVYKDGGNANLALRALAMAKERLPFEDAREAAGQLAYLLERDHDKALKRGRGI